MDIKKAEMRRIVYGAMAAVLVLTMVGTYLSWVWPGFTEPIQVEGWERPSSVFGMDSLEGEEWVGPEGEVYTITENEGVCEHSYEAARSVADDLNRDVPEGGLKYGAMALYDDPNAECVTAHRVDDQAGFLMVVIERERARRLVD